MDFTQSNQVVTQRYEAEDGEFKYTITAVTSDGNVQQVSCDVDQTVLDPAEIEAPKIVRLGTITMANGFKNVRFPAAVEMTAHVVAFEGFLASLITV